MIYCNQHKTKGVFQLQDFPLNLTNSKETTSQEFPLDFSKSSTEYKPPGNPFIKTDFYANWRNQI